MKPVGTPWWRRACLVACIVSCGCLSHRVSADPIEIKPIHITMDINLRVQKELDDFFDFEAAAPQGALSPQTPKQE